ncbi:MAG: hypothetical protein LBD58_01200, partial [Treponema sp.]|nr:hypothetical protein [Treponema sp.]
LYETIRKIKFEPHTANIALVFTSDIFRNSPLYKKSPPQYIIKHLVNKDMFWFNEGLMFPYTAPSIFIEGFFTPSSYREEI